MIKLISGFGARHKRNLCFVATLSSCLYGELQAQPTATRPDIVVRHLLNIPGTSNPIRLAQDPRDNTLYVLKENGDLYRIDLRSRSAERIARRQDHDITTAAGLAIDRNGTFYLSGYEDISDVETIGMVAKGILNLNGEWEWTRVATSAPYGRSFSIFNHRFNGILVSSDETHLLVNSGSRTDHGEIQNSNGFFPTETREVGLTAILLKIPIDAEGLILPNDREALRTQGFLLAEGLRNTYDFAYAPNGDLFGTENSPDLDLPEELNWLREGGHFGFPWRVGGEANPQQFANYNPDLDPLLNPRYNAVQNNYYRNDPTFPPAPLEMLEPVQNLGPHADKYRDSITGEVLDASDQGKAMGTLTAHRSPLGLSFDVNRVLNPEFRGDGFVLGWTEGNPTSTTLTGPFLDPSEDLLHLDFRKKDADNYEARITRLVEGFSNPIDSEMIGSSLFIIEYSGGESLWEVQLPEQFTSSAELSTTLTVAEDASVHLNVSNVSGRELKVLSSSDLVDWFAETTIPINNEQVNNEAIDIVLDAASNGQQQFYLIVSQ